MQTLIGSDLARSRIMSLVYILAVSLAGFVFPMLIPGELGGYTTVLIMLVLIFAAGWLRGTGVTEIGLNRPKSWTKTLLLGLFYAIAIFIIFRIGLEPLLEKVTGVQRDLSRFDFLKGNITAVWQTTIIIWITAAFYEEILFRGFLLSYITHLFTKTQLGSIVAIIISSLLFAFVHGYQGMSGMILTGLAAVFFCVLFLLHKKNLWIVILAHGFTDTSAILLFYFDIYEKVTHFLFI